MAPGVAAVRFTFLNAELTLHLSRLPVGPWLHLDCRTLNAGVGVGVTRVVLGDRAGAFGYAHQSLLYDAID